MPLRFRSVVPYTLPGVLALIGWWWYISRKKERLVARASPDGPPTDAGLRTSPAEGSNGLVEKSPVSPTNETEPAPAHRPSPVSHQHHHTEHHHTSCIHVQDRDAASALSSEDDAAGPDRTTGDELLQPSLPDPEGGLQVYRDTEDSSSLCLLTQQENGSTSVVEEPVEEDIVPCRSAEVTSSSVQTAYLCDAERPEPEGEVAVTPTKAQRAVQSEADSQQTPPSLQDFHQHLITSTPANADLTSAALTASSLTPEESEQDLERLAAGLICGVISAATEEVLGVARCPVTDDDGTRQLSEAEPITAQQHHHHLLTSSSAIWCESRDVTVKEQQGVSNGCSSALAPGPGEFCHEDSAHTDLCRAPGQEPAPHSKPPPSVVGDETAMLDSACHSKDGVSSEDLHNSTFSQIQVTDLSATEADEAESLLETSAKTSLLAATEENSEDAECEIKRLNGASLRNGAHGTCEETDQSGGSDVNSMDSVDSGCTMGTGESNHASSLTADLVVWEIEVPKHLVGRLIGKQGRFVSFIKQNSGAKIYISTLPYTQDFQICHIEGNQQQVDKALALIGKKFKDLDLTNYAPPPPLTLPSLPMTSWLLLPSGVTVEVIVVNIVSAGHVFVQQHTHPTYHALRSLDQQMFLCYSQPGTPGLPSPAEVGVICAAPAGEGSWWRAQVITFYKDSSEVEIRYVDYGGYDRVKIDSLRQIRSDFVTLPFQGAEVLLDNIAPLPGEDRFSTEATTALEEMTRGVPLLAQVSNYDNNTGLPLVHLWNMVGDEVVSVNRTLAERGLGLWVDGF